MVVCAGGIMPEIFFRERDRRSLFIRKVAISLGEEFVTLGDARKYRDTGLKPYLLAKEAVQTGNWAWRDVDLRSLPSDVLIFWR
jgi:hypothetical protein